RSSRFDDTAARVEPELIVSTDIARLGRAIHPITRSSRFQFLDFFFGEELLSAKLPRPLKRRDGWVGPYALQVRLAIRSFCRSPRLCGLCRERCRKEHSQYRDSQEMELHTIPQSSRRSLKSPLVAP